MTRRDDLPGLQAQHERTRLTLSRGLWDLNPLSGRRTEDERAYEQAGEGGKARSSPEPGREDQGLTDEKECSHQKAAV